jgi:hypothetical protein
MTRQKVECHNCNGSFEVDIDLTLNGNHVFRCPNCNHEHCRVVKDGVITDIRWDTRNGQTYNVISYSFTSSSTADSCSIGDMGGYLRQAWYNSTISSSVISTYY